MPVTTTEIQEVMGRTDLHDKMYLFLQNIFRLYPEDRLHTLLKEASRDQKVDDQIYRRVQGELPSIKPFLADLTFGLPALKKQKQVIKNQTLQLLGTRTQLNGYAEIGSTGRYISALKSAIQLTGPIYLINDQAPSHSPGDIFERGQLAKFGTFVPLNDYQPIPSSAIKDESIDLVTCYIGIHHAAQEILPKFIESIVRILRPGGMFILRDHDAATPDMVKFCSAIHTVFNLGTKAPWEINAKELRFFNSASYWSEYLKRFGLKDAGVRLLQDHDPSDNALMLFTKEKS
jgi:SAM-dependent methyltransferase